MKRTWQRVWAIVNRDGLVCQQGRPNDVAIFFERRRALETKYKWERVVPVEVRLLRKKGKR